MIEVSHLTKKYGNHVAVDDLSFCVEEGQIYGFLGPNGAGKSTTMNMLTGYLGATSGEIKIDGHDIYKEPEEAKRNIGYLPELPPVYDTMTVKEYLAFVAELKKIDKKERRKQIGEVMELTKITSMQDRLIQNLSKGYKQRVGLAQAILGFPDMIILDEPSVGLDPKQIIEMRDLIRKLAENHTVILSSHILTEIREVCDYILIISKGKLVAQDTLENLEKMIGFHDVIELETSASEEEIHRILGRIPGVCAMQMRVKGEKCTYVQVKVTGDKSSQNNRKVREEIFCEFAKEKKTLYSLSAPETSLEEAFMKLTQNDNIERNMQIEESLVKDRQVKDGRVKESRPGEKQIGVETRKCEMNTEGGKEDEGGL